MAGTLTLQPPKLTNLVTETRPEVVESMFPTKVHRLPLSLNISQVLDYCLHEGSEVVVTWARKNIFLVKTLREFQYIDEDARDVGQNGSFEDIRVASFTYCS